MNELGYRPDESTDEPQDEQNESNVKQHRRGSKARLVHKKRTDGSPYFEADIQSLDAVRQVAY